MLKILNLQGSSQKFLKKLPSKSPLQPALACNENTGSVVDKMKREKRLFKHSNVKDTCRSSLKSNKCV